MERHEREIGQGAAATRATVGRLAAEWGAEWTPAGDGGRLALPVVFGLRRGVAVGRLEVAPLGVDRCRVAWELEESHLEVHRGSVVVLSLAAVPLVAVLGWPLWPPLLALAPLAAVLGLLAWWLVVSRLRSSGPEDFLAALEPEVTATR
ncbi:MAG TPA: hypothetical protein VLA66_11570 [Thermoanaerobaculia bacterium]|nr:hypothetical protein [Thermoanaerobaculia bacterium]